MRKSELRDKFRRYERLTKRRLRNEEAIIEALPIKLDVVRIVPARDEGTPENGGLEIEVRDYAEALALPDLFRQLAPIPMAYVEAERAPGHITRSFLPLCRVPMRWYEAAARSNNGGASVGEVYPVLVQLCPSEDPLRPKVVFEWFAELKHELVVNVRAAVKEHPVVWRSDNGMPHKRGYTWPGAPEAHDARVLYIKPGQPPFVTLWWGKRLRFFPHVIRGEEVAHVND